MGGCGRGIPSPSPQHEGDFAFSDLIFRHLIHPIGEILNFCCHKKGKKSYNMEVRGHRVARSHTRENFVFSQSCCIHLVKYPIFVFYLKTWGKIYIQESVGEGEVWKENTPSHTSEIFVFSNLKFRDLAHSFGEISEICFCPKSKKIYTVYSWKYAGEVYGGMHPPTKFFFFPRLRVLWCTMLMTY